MGNVNLRLAAEDAMAGTHFVPGGRETVLIAVQADLAAHISGGMYAAVPATCIV